ncbi:MAG: hypothetical protein QOC77_3303 [Thermoleophilaceae bacterium]|nr:hypothetical protein [Thermoleophilaceae bacterium]
MRPQKRWRYVGAYGPEVMACVGDVRIGPLRQRFWAVCEPGRPVVERTTLSRGGVLLAGSRALVATRDVRIDLVVEEDGGVETRHADDVWTRKQAGVPVRGRIEVSGRNYDVDCLGVVDDTQGRHRRHTTWTWSAGVGRGEGGERVGWNLVTGVNDTAEGSERCVWIDGEPAHVAPVEFADDLSRVSFSEGGGLDFVSWGAREDRTNLLLLRSEYRQPFGTFSGSLPGGVALAEGYGVMEWHDVWW